MNEANMEGRNLLLGTGTLEKNDEVAALTGTVQAEALFRGCYTLKTTRAWYGYKFNFQKAAQRAGLQVGDTLTYSIWVRFDGTPVKKPNLAFFARDEANGRIPGCDGVDVTPEVEALEDWQVWRQAAYTFTVTEAMMGCVSMRIETSYYENSDHTMEQAHCIYACPKLEVGGAATDWTPAPEDAEQEEKPMAIIATGSKTIIDLSDGKSLTAYLGSNQPRTQISDVNAGSYTPDWTSAAGRLVITPVVYANQTAISLTDAALSITYKRKEGSGAEAALSAGETVTDNVLTVSQNKLSGIASGMLTYIAYVAYIDPDTKMTINAMTDITYTLVRTGRDARSAWISGEQAFKYAASGAVSPAQIVLTANVQGVTVSRWQYKKSDGAWADYPTTSDNATISSATLTVKPGHGIWVGDMATVRVVTSDAAIGDTTSLYKVKDGAVGGTGQAAPVAFLTNENMTFAGDAAGKVAAVTKLCQVVAYRGTSKVTPTVGTITGAPEGMTVTKGTAANNEVPISITVTAGATLGGTGSQQGELLVPITAPVSTTLKITWSKVNTGATGAVGADAIVFSLYAPEGTVFQNQAGSKTIQTAAYKGSAAITSGAAYVWEKYASGAWSVVTGQTGASLTVAGGDVTGTASFRCKMTYEGKTYQDAITLTDKTDNYQAVIDSTGGDVFKNTVGTSTLTCRLFQNGVEVDAGGKGHTYTWYRRDKDGNAMDGGKAFKTGKSIAVDGSHVDVKTTFVCEVS